METQGQTILSREQIKKVAHILKTELVDVPEWGGTIMIRELRGYERSEIETFYAKREKDTRGMRETLLCKACINPDGTNLFEKDDDQMLCDASSAVLERVGNKIMELSGMVAKAVEEAEKNSGTTQTS